MRRLRRPGDPKDEPTGRWRGELMVGWKFVDPADGGEGGGERSRMTLGDFLGFWLDNVVRRRRGRKTFIVYEQNMRNHVVAYLEHLCLSELRAEQLEELYGELHRNGRIEQQRGVSRTTSPGLSPETIRTIHSGLHAVLEHATVTMRLLPRNIASDVSPITSPPREMLCLTADEARRFLHAAETAGYRQAGGGRLAALWWILLGTGMRVGEVLALRWSDYDAARGVVWVRRTLHHGAAIPWAISACHPTKRRRTSFRALSTPPQNAER